MVEYIVLICLILGLNIIPNKLINRKKYILPFSFLLIGFFLSVRYDYGLDYWGYYDLYAGDYKNVEKGTGEKLFFYIMHLFPRYYLFIIFQSIVLVVCLYYIARKYVNSKYYSLFFLFLLGNTGFFFNSLSALRTTLSACILWVALDFCYFNKFTFKNVILYILLVVVASFIHTAVISFLIIPLAHLLFYKFLNHRTLVYFFFIFCCIGGLFWTNNLYNFIFTNIPIFNDYDFYLDVTASFNFNGMIIRAVNLIPIYYMFKYYPYYSDIYKKILLVSILYSIIYFLGIDFQNRFTVYMLVFFIISMLYVLPFTTRIEKIIIFIPMCFKLCFLVVQFFQLLETYNSSGNPLFYHTIFEAPCLI